MKMRVSFGIVEIATVIAALLGASWFGYGGVVAAIVTSILCVLAIAYGLLWVLGYECYFETGPEDIT